MAATASKIRRSTTITLPDGKKKRIFARGDTLKEALRNLAKLEAEYAEGKKVSNSNTLFNAWAEECLSIYKAPEVTSGTLENHRRLVRLHFAPYIGQMPINAITPAHIQMCLTAQAGKSADHLKKCYNTINFIMEKARLGRLVKENPVEYATIPKGNQAEHRRALTDAERELFLQAAKQTANGDIFLTSYYCGLRPAEVRALKWSNVDLNAQTITITNAVEAKTDKLTKPKSDAGYRTIPVPDRLAERLKQLPNQEPNNFVFTGTQEVFKARRYLRNWNALKHTMDKLGGAEVYRNQIIKSVIDEDITPYYLRHTYCTMLAENNIPLKTAQYLMGHSSITLTANIYTHVTEKMVQTTQDIVRAL